MPRIKYTINYLCAPNISTWVTINKWHILYAIYVPSVTCKVPWYLYAAYGQYLKPGNRLIGSCNVCSQRMGMSLFTAGGYTNLENLLIGGVESVKHYNVWLQNNWSLLDNILLLAIIYNHKCILAILATCFITLLNMLALACMYVAVFWKFFRHRGKWAFTY